MITKGKDFIANEAYMIITANEERNCVITASLSLPEIIFMDTLFNVKRVLVGPDKFDVAFSKYDDGQIIPDKITEGYSNLYKTDNYVYLVYEGYCAENKKGNFPDYRREKCEIIKMDWEGNVKHIYKLQNRIFYITVKNDRELIGTSYDGNEKYLVRYILEE